PSSSCTIEMSAKPAMMFTEADSQAMVAGEAADGRIRNGRQRRWIERKISRQPGVFRQRQHMAERGAFGNAARDEIRGLEREFRRAPALRQGGKFAPIGSVMIPCRARPCQQQPVA